MTNSIGGVGDGPYGIREPEKIFTQDPSLSILKQAQLESRTMMASGKTFPKMKCFRHNALDLANHGPITSIFR